jgi:hypothetical protein
VISIKTKKYYELLKGSHRDINLHKFAAQSGPLYFVRPVWWCQVITLTEQVRLLFEGSECGRLFLLPCSSDLAKDLPVWSLVSLTCKQTILVHGKIFISCSYRTIEGCNMKTQKHTNITFGTESITWSCSDDEFCWISRWLAVSMFLYSSSQTEDVIVPKIESLFQVTTVLWCIENLNINSCDTPCKRKCD